MRVFFKTFSEIFFAAFNTYTTELSAQMYVGVHTECPCEFHLGTRWCVAFFKFQPP